MVIKRTALNQSRELPTVGEQPGNIYFEGQSIGQIPYADWSGFEALDQTGKETYISEHFGKDVSGQMWSSAPATVFTQEQIDVMGTRLEAAPSDIPTFGEGAAAEIPTPEIIPAPAYEISPEQQEAMDLYGDKITDWVESGGYGLDPETQAQMIQLQTDTLKAREGEQVRVMKNNMERRGITNSGFLISAENAIHSNTSVAIAGAIADVQIKSALMKMASFEKAMGATAQYLGFLSEQSQLAYAPEFATWQAEQMAKMQVWQGKLDIYKMELNQAYQTQNLTLQAQLQSQLNAEQNAFDQEMLEIQIDATQQAAQAEGIGSIIGTILGIGASLIFGVPLFGF